MPRTVLLIEDSPDDAFLISKACEQADIPHTLVHMQDGESGIEYLKGTNHLFPELVFLDIKLPKMTGHDVLEWIRNQEGMKHLPVVMLTHSDDSKDVERAYQLGVTSYLMKTAAPGELSQAVRIILKYWVQLNIAP